MNTEELKFYNKGIQEGKRHIEPSIETMKQLTKIKDHCAARGTEIALMQKDIKNNMVKLDKILSKLDTIENRFAAKWVERWVVAVTIIFALAALWVIFEGNNLPH